MTLPQIPRHSGDRNRTSPFAFTGNRFEFRAVGSSASIAWPNTVLNTVVAESLDYMATQLERRAGRRPTHAKLESTVRALLKTVLKQHRRVVFDGDNYDAQWHAEAQRRGLPNLRTTADALPAMKTAKARKLFERYGVLNKRELTARADIAFERYNTVVSIEARTLVAMLRREVLPAALRYQTDVSKHRGRNREHGRPVRGRQGATRKTGRIDRAVSRPNQRRRTGHPHQKHER